MIEALQIVGAILILSGFAASQLGWLGAKSVPYLVVNAVGAAILAVVALVGRDWGFLLLEGVWTIVSVVSLAQVVNSRANRPARPPTHPA